MDHKVMFARIRTIKSLLPKARAKEEEYQKKRAETADLNIKEHVRLVKIWAKWAEKAYDLEIELKDYKEKLPDYLKHICDIR